MRCMCVSCSRRACWQESGRRTGPSTGIYTITLGSSRKNSSSPSRQSEAIVTPQPVILSSSIKQLDTLIHTFTHTFTHIHTQREWTHIFWVQKLSKQMTWQTGKHVVTRMLRCCNFMEQKWTLRTFCQRCSQMLQYFALFVSLKSKQEKLWNQKSFCTDTTILCEIS